MSDKILFEDFMKVDMRIGKILKAEDFPKAKVPAYKLTIDFGKDIGIKRSSAQITMLYAKEDLEGMMIVAVVNFPPKQVADFLSEVLVLGAKQNEGEVVLLTVDNSTVIGTRIS
ncbi:MAG: tRNA-binding protein [Bacteroidota bacterium]|nr:tRNA-binding protein [Bacteroidota bacterium]MDP4236025.1 tRNA-binding protein [Bacteroidota bacterium]